MAKTDGVKKRKPPTFHHLPEIRAKKLKRSWVEVQKIKSQWKAQKRREGLVTGGRLKDAGAVEIDEHTRPQTSDGPEKDRDEEDMSSAEKSSADEDNELDDDEQGDESDGSIEGDDIAVPSLAQNNTFALNSGTRGKHPQIPVKERRSKHMQEPARKVYPKPSLPSHRSNPHQRRHDQEARRGSDVRGTGNVRGGSHRGRGRGQPNMGVRMNAMLEKIKRDFT